MSTAERDWSKWAPPAPYPPFDRREFKPGQVWASRVEDAVYVFRVQAIEFPGMLWVNDLFERGMGFIGPSPRVICDGPIARHAVLVQDVIQAEPTPPEVLYQGALATRTPVRHAADPALAKALVDNHPAWLKAPKAATTHVAPAVGQVWRGYLSRECRVTRLCGATGCRSSNTEHAHFDNDTHAGMAWFDEAVLVREAPPAPAVTCGKPIGITKGEVVAHCSLRVGHPPGANGPGCEGTLERPEAKRFSGPLINHPAVRPTRVEVGQRWDCDGGVYVVHSAEDAGRDLWKVRLERSGYFFTWYGHGILRDTYLGMAKTLEPAGPRRCGAATAGCNNPKEGHPIAECYRGQSGATPSALVPAYLRRPDPNRAVEEYQKLLNGLTPPVGACEKPIHSTRGHVVAFCNLSAGHAEGKCEWSIARAREGRDNLSVGYRYEPAMDAQPKHAAEDAGACNSCGERPRLPHELICEPCIERRMANADASRRLQRDYIGPRTFTADVVPPRWRPIERPARYPEVTEDDLLPDV